MIDRARTRYRIPGVGPAVVRRSRLSELRDGVCSDGEGILVNLTPPWLVGGVWPTTGAAGASLCAWSWLTDRHNMIIHTSRRYPIHVRPSVIVTGSLEERLQAIIWWGPVGPHCAWFLQPAELHTSIGVGYYAEWANLTEDDVQLMVTRLQIALEEGLAKNAPSAFNRLSLTSPPWKGSVNFGVEPDWDDACRAMMDIFNDVVSSDSAWRVRRPRPVHISWR